MTIDPDQLETITAIGKVQVSLQDLSTSVEVPKGLPPDLNIQFDYFITKVTDYLHKHWDYVLASGAKYQVSHHDANHSASATTFYFGIWEIMSSVLYLSAETQL